MNHPEKPDSSSCFCASGGGIRIGGYRELFSAIEGIGFP